MACYTLPTSLLWVSVACLTPALAAERVDIWPDLAPGETTRELGVAQPARPEEKPTITRVEKITRPTLDLYLADRPTGTCVVILPGGGFSKVVPDKEGSEAAVWLNRQGISCFVLNYRTQNSAEQVGWQRALQDAQRAMKVVRSRASEFKVDAKKVGLLGFSAGGQVAARLLCDGGKIAYAPVDSIDDYSHLPDVALLIYPWNIYDEKQDRLIEGVSVPADCPPTFLAHTHDDRSSSLGAVLFYTGLKKQNIASELHVYGNGGHGYGMREVPGSQIATWIVHAGHWIQANGF